MRNWNTKGTWCCLTKCSWKSIWMMLRNWWHHDYHKWYWLLGGKHDLYLTELEKFKKVGERVELYNTREEMGEITIKRVNALLIRALCCCALLVMINYFIFSYVFIRFSIIHHCLCERQIWFKLIYIFMDMKRHMLIYFFISMLVDRGKEWGSYKMEVFITKGKK
jgi:hypothetical protein